MQTQSPLLSIGFCVVLIAQGSDISSFAQTNTTNSAMLPPRSFLGMGGIVTTPARNASPHFLGKELPQPPQQAAAWSALASSLPTNYVTASALLFEQGLADPRGCEYREIEVGTGNIWAGDGGVVKTRGWVLPTNGPQHFAVCWNGLVYPLVSMGDTADWRADARAAVQRATRRWNQALPEGFTLTCESCLPIKGCLLLRLGEPELARQMWAAVQFGQQKGFDAPPGASPSEIKELKLNEADPYLEWASDWAWSLFESALCAHMRADDRLALVRARLLSSVRPKIETAAEKRGLKRQPTFNSPWDGKYQDYLNFLGPLPALLADQERRSQRREPAKPLEEIKNIPNQKLRTDALIDALEDAANHQFGQPGGLGPWDWTPEAAALIEQGQSAVEPLLQCLETDCANRLARSISFGRDFHRGRMLHPVSAPIIRILHSILNVTTFGSWATTNELAQAGTNPNRIFATQVRAWLKKFANRTPPERWYKTLLDDSVDGSLWVDAAANITKNIAPASRDSTNPPVMQGEVLRAKQNPSLTEIMARRIRQVTITNFPDSLAFNGFRAACAFALDLSKWDPTGAVPTLRWQMDLARIHSDPSDWFSVAYGQPIFVQSVANLTMARIQGGDTNALQDYAAWLGSRKPGQGLALEPASKFPDAPPIIAALQNLLSNSNSLWRPSLVASIGSTALADELVASPLLGRGVVRHYFLAGLRDQTHAGVVNYRPSPFRTNDLWSVCKYDNGAETTLVAPQKDKLPVDLAKAYPLRVCDLFAEKLASVDTAPPFALYWSLKDRDESIQAIIKFVEEKAEKLTDLVEQKRKRDWWKH